MKFSQEDGILIKNLYQSKQYGARRLLSELPDKGCKLGSIDSLLKRIRKTGTYPATRHAAADRVCRITTRTLRRWRRTSCSVRKTN